MAPLGGGTFTAENKVLPGAYINFVHANAAVAVGDRGTVTLPLVLKWGQEGEIITITAADFNKKSMELLGYPSDSAELLLVREAMKRARVLKLYRINTGGVAATATIGGITWKAAHTGTRGNDFKGAVQVNIDDENLFDVITYIGQTEIDRQTVADAAGLVANAYVTFGEGTLEVAAAAPLTGGGDGMPTGTAYSDYLQKIEVEQFDAMGYPGTDETTRNLFVAFATRLNDTEGKKLQCVLAGTAADHPAITNVKNGVVLEDGTVLPAEQAVCWVAAASAAAQINESLTNTVYEGAVDVDKKYTQTEHIEAVKNGEFVFYPENGKARVVSDINSMVTTNEERPEDLKHNRVLRVLNGWANEVAAIFGSRYIGVQTNDETGRQLFKADIVAVADSYQAMDAISDFDPNDVVIEQGSDRRTVVVTNSLRPNDSMEKLYMTTRVE